MNHDPLCPRWMTTMNGDTWHPFENSGTCLLCDLIAKVRADEREKAAQRVRALVPNGYMTWEQPHLMNESNIAAWEAVHGHDVRMKCYAEYGCQLLLDPVDAIAAARGEAS
jgi:hypothetical protein